LEKWEKTLMPNKLRALVAAAGLGSRARLPYPKTLYRVRGIPILLRIYNLIKRFDSKPTVIVSPEGKKPILDCLSNAGVDAWLVVQEHAKGMGDAVLRFIDSQAFSDAEHVLLIWGDIPFIQPETLETIVDTHLKKNNDFTFATRFVESAYTIVSRDTAGNVTGVVETREKGFIGSSAGERDIGLFIFRKEPVLFALREDLAGKYGVTTGEHGFLYVIEHLVSRGLVVDALPVATELDLISLNSLEDLAVIDPMKEVNTIL
jgi:bifunctional UDP-N-acetylglucosamine pyrophosphorylase/glucosamine-1-phosphate N-acetyltransferase